MLEDKPLPSIVLYPLRCQDTRRPYQSLRYNGHWLFPRKGLRVVGPHQSPTPLNPDPYLSTMGGLFFGRLVSRSGSLLFQTQALCSLQVGLDFVGFLLFLCHSFPMMSLAFVFH